jgi:hypothetical protein
VATPAASRRLDQWEAVNVAGVAFVSCPVCGAALLHADTMALARHVLWHHNRDEWPWER